MANAVQQHVGQTIRAMLELLDGEKMRRVVVATSPTRTMRPRGSSSPAPPAAGGHRGERLLLLAGEPYGTLTAEHRPDPYRCAAVEAGYPGGGKVEFANVPDAGFTVVEGEVQPPEVVGEWGKMP